MRPTVLILAALTVVALAVARRAPAAGSTWIMFGTLGGPAAQARFLPVYAGKITVAHDLDRS